MFGVLLLWEETTSGTAAHFYWVSTNNAIHPLLFIELERKKNRKKWKRQGQRETERASESNFSEKRFVRCSGILRSVNLMKAIIPDIYDVWKFPSALSKFKDQKIGKFGKFFTVCLKLVQLCRAVEQLMLGLMLSWKHSINFRIHHFVFTAQDFVKRPLKKFKGPLLYD